MRLARDVPVVDEASPTRTNSQSEPASATRTDSFANGRGNWDNPASGSGPDVQRTLQGLALGDIPNNPYSLDRGPGTGGYVNSEASASNDTGLSPDTTQSTSNRPTPNSSTTSDSRPNLQPGHGSGSASFETSPAASGGARLPATDGRSMSSFFANQPDYSGISSTGMTPDSNAFVMPETPGRGFDVPPGWEMSQQSTGLTPVGEGVFRQLMGLGPMDPMDIGWEGGP